MTILYLAVNDRARSLKLTLMRGCGWSLIWILSRMTNGSNQNGDNYLTMCGRAGEKSYLSRGCRCLRNIVHNINRVKCSAEWLIVVRDQTSRIKCLGLSLLEGDNPAFQEYPSYPGEVWSGIYTKPDRLNGRKRVTFPPKPKLSDKSLSRTSRSSVTFEKLDKPMGAGASI